MKPWGTRMVPFSREIYIEQDDFMEDPPHKFFRLAPGTEVRLKGAYIIKCEGFKKNEKQGRLKRYIVLMILQPEAEEALPRKKLKEPCTGFRLSMR